MLLIYFVQRDHGQTDHRSEAIDKKGNRQTKNRQTNDQENNYKDGKRTEKKVCNITQLQLLTMFEVKTLKVKYMPKTYKDVFLTSNLLYRAIAEFWTNKKRLHP